VRVGVIGGGTSGLVTAWLLQQHHEVTLLERQHRWGGHAHTLDVEVEGERVGIDAGFEFFSTSMFPRFNRLLQLLAVPVHDFGLRVAVYPVDRDRRHVLLLPPVQGLRPRWSRLTPGRIVALLQLQHLLRDAGRVVDTADPLLTLERFLARHRFTSSARRRLIDPLLQAGWCLDWDEFTQFAAYDVLSYFALNKPDGVRSPQMREVVGGTKAYVDTLVGALGPSRGRLGVQIARVTRGEDGTYLVEEQDRTRHEFDHLVLATPADEAAQLLGQVGSAAEARGILGRVSYFPTTIAVHGDTRLMPQDRRDWCEANIRYDDRHSSFTIWKRWKSEHPVFRSWVTFDSELPRPLYGLASYRHPKVDREYFTAQVELARRQGEDNLWFAGVHAYGVDCHESAVMSAAHVAQRLAPASANLAALLAGSERSADHR
jgi:uncharacterized protein